MTVRCPECGTTYRRPARSRSRGDATFRCARCHHVFEAAGEEPTRVEPDEIDTDDTFIDEPAPRRRRNPRHDDEPDFTFGDDIDDEDQQDEPPVRPSPKPAGRDRGDDEVSYQGSSPARFAVRALLTIVLAYAIFSIYLYTHPDSLRRAFDGVPLLGASLADTRVSAASVQLADVKGEYQRVKGDRLVFVISATAMNNARIPIRSIQVEGRVSGAREDRQVVFCGASRRDVRDLSRQEIIMLQGLEPPKDWVLSPGEQASCQIVFIDPAADLKHFAAEVVAVQAPPRRSGQEG